MPRTRSLIALLAGCVAADESATNVRRALALSGLLDDATCSAAFVGARWVDTSGESPLSRGELGAYFGAGLTVTSFEADDEECARQEAAIAARPAEARVAAERCVARAPAGGAPLRHLSGIFLLERVWRSTQPPLGNIPF